MKYVCLGYYDKAKFDALPEAERNAMFDACFAYDEHLRANGHWGSGGEALQGAETAKTVGEERQSDNDRRSLRGNQGTTRRHWRSCGAGHDHAVQLMSQHPALKYGTIWEIRPAGDMNGIKKASDQRRRKNAAR